MDVDSSRGVIVPVIVVLTVALVWLATAGPPPSAFSTTSDLGDGPWKEFKRPSDDALKRALTPLQYKVTQRDGTEPPFRNTFWDLHEPGIFVDVVSGEPLFSSLDKFESGSGWPSFTRPLIRELVVEYVDDTLGMQRVEVRSKIADSHLGHVFPDGPEPTGLRYCINSASMRFVPAERLEGEGYGEFVQLFESGKKGSKREEATIMSAKTEVATLAGGCFWGMEDILRDIPGVTETEVGYTGGHVDNATYQDVSTLR